MKKLKKCSSSKVMKAMMAMLCAILFFIGQKTISLADETGKAITSAKIRQSADVNSNVVGGLSQGASVTIVNEVNDASGTLWYEVSVGDTKGYVRADLIEKGAAGTDTAAAAAPQAGAAASGAEVGPDTVLDAQYATVTASAAKIRSKASTSASPVDSMPQHTSMIVSGQTTGSDGIWYYVLFKGTNGEDKTGYVREDLIELGEMVPTDEPEQNEPEPTPEEPVEEPVVSVDYIAVYEAPHGDGIYDWYLQDYTGESPTRQKIEDLLNAAHVQSVNARIDAATISKQRIAIVVLVALVIILAVVLTFMFFKLRDSFYEEDEGDSDSWKAERSGRDSSDVRSGRSSGGSRRSNSGKQEEPVRRKSTVREEQQPPVRKKPVNQEKKAPAKEVTYEENEAPRPKPAPKKKAKNFLADDDDFEFEFLNMKDKDKGDE